MTCPGQTTTHRIQMHHTHEGDADMTSARIPDIKAPGRAATHSDGVNEVIRESVAEAVYDALLDQVDDDLIKVWEPEEATGPMGGEQRTILLAIDTGREIRGALVVVYSDDRVQHKLEGAIQKERHRKETREALLAEIKDEEAAE